MREPTESDARLVTSLTAALTPLKDEIAAIRQEVSSAAASTSEQTERLIAATKQAAGAQRVYTALTVVLVGVAFFQGWHTYKQKVSAEQAAAVAREARCSTVRVGLDVLKIEQRILAGQAAWGSQEDIAQLRSRMVEVEQSLRRVRDNARCP